MQKKYDQKTDIGEGGKDVPKDKIAIINRKGDLRRIKPESKELAFDKADTFNEESNEEVFELPELGINLKAGHSLRQGKVATLFASPMDGRELLVLKGSGRNQEKGKGDDKLEWINSEKEEISLRQLGDEGLFKIFGLDKESDGRDRLEDRIGDTTLDNGASHSIVAVQGLLDKSVRYFYISIVSHELNRGKSNYDLKVRELMPPEDSG